MLVYTPRVARVVRASTLVVRELLFVEAVRALGVRTSRILWRHILPNLMSPILVQVSFIFAYAILAEAGLSFLGVGVPPEIPTWGTMVAGSQQYAHQAFWIVLFPGLAIIFTALSLQLLGDGVRDLLDPKLKKSAMRATLPTRSPSRADMKPQLTAHPRRRDPRQGAGRAPRDPASLCSPTSTACSKRASSNPAERAGSSVPTIMRTCRDLGFAGLREFKLALAQELALGGSPLHRRVNIEDAADEVVGEDRAQRRRDGGRRAQPARHGGARRLRSARSPARRHIDIVGAGNTSWFMATDLQARLFRLGLSANAWADYHLQQVAAGAQRPGGVVIAITHVGGMPSLLDAVDIARAPGREGRSRSRGPAPLLAERADMAARPDACPTTR